MTTFLKARSMAVLLLVGLALAAAACGGDAQPAGSTKVTMTEFQFSPSDLSVSGGKVVFYLVDSGTTSHNLVIKDSSDKVVAKSSLVQAGSSTVFTVDNLPAGSYKIVCDVSGHTESGMIGTLTAK
jgi:plastocyanin